MRPYCFFCAVTLFLTLTNSLSGHAQTIPKGAEAIEIHTTLVDSVAYERLITQLLSDGYVPKISDEKRKVVTTENRPIKVSVWTARIIGNVQSGTIKLRTDGSVDLMGIHMENEPLTFKGGGTSAYKVGFNTLNAFAKGLMSTIPNAVLTYTVPPSTR